jgi:C-terminal processing protease CtpA/Prc
LTDHKFFIRSVFGEMAVISDWWFQRVYSAQKGWDIIMAESIIQELAKKTNRNSIGIIIAGSNHVKYSLGIPYRLKLRGKNFKVATVIPIHLPAPKKKGEDEPENPMLKMLKKNADPTAVFSRGIGDFVFAVPSPAQPHYPQLGIQGMMQKDGYHISWVHPEGLAKKNGLRKGDIIVDLDGHSLESKETMNKIMATKKWDDAMTVRVFKKIELKKADTKKTDQ